MTRRYGGTCSKRHRMRCSRGKHGCGRRFTLKRHPNEYKRAVRCPHCKSPFVDDVEQDRRRQQLRETTCDCSMYPFPHRAGSLPMCVQNPNAEDPSEEDIYDYQRCLMTPRYG